MISAQDEQALEKFFYAFSQTMNQMSMESLKVFYHVPCVFVSSDDKAVCSNAAQIEKRLSELFHGFQPTVPVKHEATIVHGMSLSDSVLFAKVDWRMLNENNDSSFRCSTSYTLERGGEHGFDIIVSVIDEEEKALDDLFSQVEE